MKGSTYIRAIYYSFFSRDLYRDVGRKWEGIGFLYLFVVLLLLLIIPAVANVYQLGAILKDPESIEKNKDRNLFGTDITLDPIVRLIEQFPTLRIESGKAYADVAQPYYIYMAGSKAKDPILVIDTTGEFTTTFQAKALILITDQYVITMDDGGKESKKVDFSKIDDAMVDKYKLYSWLKWQPLIYYPGIVFFHFLVFSINAMIFGLFGVGLCKYMKIDFGYKANIRLAVVTSTPIIALDVVASSFGAQLFMNPSFIYLLAHAAYMYHAVESNREKK